MTLPNNQYVFNANCAYATDTVPFIISKFREEFIENSSLNFKCWEEEFPAKISKDRLLELVSKSVEISTGQAIRRVDLSESVIEFTTMSGSTLKVFLIMNEKEEDYYDPDGADTTITGDAIIASLKVAGYENVVDDFITNFKKSIKQAQSESKTSMIRWVFSTAHGQSDKTFQISKEWDIDRIYYPWIETDLETYYKAFLKSNAQILVLYGSPGTGKTSFIRDLICETNSNAFISYDLKVLISDSTFVRYLTDPIFDMIVIEDADELLMSERGEHNKVIAKILNISDGLIKLPKKKLIFTTNIPKVDDIDPAIIRPGRCFDVMEFRMLETPEAAAVAKKLNIELPPSKLKGKYSLAELFYSKSIANSTDPFTTHKLNTRKIGFN